MNNLSILAALLLLIFTGCLKTEVEPHTSIQPAETAVKLKSKSEIKEIRQQLELVNLGLLSLLDDQLLIDLTYDKTLHQKTARCIRIIDLATAYNRYGASLSDALFNGVLTHTGDEKQALAVVESFNSFSINGVTYYPAITPIGIRNQTTEASSIPKTGNRIPEYIVNRAEPTSELFYGYLSNGGYTYMKTEHLTTLNGWVVSVM